MEGDTTSKSTDAHEFKVPGLAVSKKFDIIKPQPEYTTKEDTPNSDKEEPGPVSDSPSNDLKQAPNEGKYASESQLKSVEEEKRGKQRQPVKQRPDVKLNYEAPAEAMPFDTRYSLEVLKTGSIMDRVEFSKDKTFFVAGRIPSCDIIAENPTVSRVHAIFQFLGGKAKKNEEESNSKSDDTSGNSEDTNSECKERGLYLYDLNSTHGTFLNKNQIYPRRYYRLRVGHMVKFGNSSRHYIVEGPSEDQEEESEKTVTELLKERLERELIRKKLIPSTEVEEKESAEDNGIDWGMGEDAVEETDYNMEVNPFAADFEAGEFNLDNPKKTLAGWFEREGYDNLFYDVREKASGHFICRVNLPLDGQGGTPIFAEVDLKGKKKEVITQCALKACQLLDKYGVLRQSHHEGYKRKMKNWEQKDYYSSDEDTFLDRTGSIETKRKRRMRQSGKDDEKADSYESLSEKYKSLEEELEKLQVKIHKAEVKEEKGEDEEDPLDAFMQNVKSGVLEIKQMKSKLKQLKEEQARIKKLMDIARPANIPISLSTKKEASQLSSTSLKPEQDIDITQTEHSIDSVNADKFPPGAFSSPRKRSHPASQLNDDERNEESQAPSKSKKLIGPDIPTAILHKIVNEKSGDVEEENTQEKVFPSTGESVQNPEIDDSAQINELDNQGQVQEEDSSSMNSKKKRKRNRAYFKKDDKAEYDANNPDYSDWVPPVDQAGDGRTKLNEKLGY